MFEIVGFFKKMQIFANYGKKHGFFKEVLYVSKVDGLLRKIGYFRQKSNISIKLVFCRILEENTHFLRILPKIRNS